ncbi:hypothetical protein DIPPA_17261 [Diplonema papillatum]|nr:hypothetical protein DIPPA_17261 [Diplonema papillatum]
MKVEMPAGQAGTPYTRDELFQLAGRGGSGADADGKVSIRKLAAGLLCCGLAEAEACASVLLCEMSRRLPAVGDQWPAGLVEDDMLFPAMLRAHALSRSSADGVALGRLLARICLAGSMNSTEFAVRATSSGLHATLNLPLPSIPGDLTATDKTCEELTESLEALADLCLDPPQDAGLLARRAVTFARELHTKRTVAADHGEQHVPIGEAAWELCDRILGALSSMEGHEYVIRLTSEFVLFIAYADGASVVRSFEKQAALADAGFKKNALATLTSAVVTATSISTVDAIVDLAGFVCSASSALHTAWVERLSVLHAASEVNRNRFCSCSDRVRRVCRQLPGGVEFLIDSLVYAADEDRLDSVLTDLKRRVHLGGVQQQNGVLLRPDTCGDDAAGCLEALRSLFVKAAALRPSVASVLAAMAGKCNSPAEAGAFAKRAFDVRLVHDTFAFLSPGLAASVAGKAPGDGTDGPLPCKTEMFVDDCAGLISFAAKHHDLAAEFVVLPDNVDKLVVSLAAFPRCKPLASLVSTVSSLSRDPAASPRSILLSLGDGRLPTNRIASLVARLQAADDHARQVVDLCGIPLLSDLLPEVLPECPSSALLSLIDTTLSIMTACLRSGDAAGRLDAYHDISRSAVPAACINYWQAASPFLLARTAEADFPYRKLVAACVSLLASYLLCSPPTDTDPAALRVVDALRHPVCTCLIRDTRAYFNAHRAAPSASFTEAARLLSEAEELLHRPVADILGDLAGLSAEGGADCEAAALETTYSALAHQLATAPADAAGFRAGGGLPVVCQVLASDFFSGCPSPPTTGRSAAVSDRASAPSPYVSGIADDLFSGVLRHHYSRDDASSRTPRSTEEEEEDAGGSVEALFLLRQAFGCGSGEAAALAERLLAGLPFIDRELFCTDAALAVCGSPLFFAAVDAFAEYCPDDERSHPATESCRRGEAHCQAATESCPAATEQSRKTLALLSVAASVASSSEEAEADLWTHGRSFATIQAGLARCHQLRGAAAAAALPALDLGAKILLSAAACHAEAGIQKRDAVSALDWQPLVVSQAGCIEACAFVVALRTPYKLVYADGEGEEGSLRERETSWHLFLRESRVVDTWAAAAAGSCADGRVAWCRLFARAAACLKAEHFDASGLLAWLGEAAPGCLAADEAPRGGRGGTSPFSSAACENLFGAALDVASALVGNDAGPFAASAFFAVLDEVAHPLLSRFCRAHPNTHHQSYLEQLNSILHNGRNAQLSSDTAPTDIPADDTPPAPASPEEAALVEKEVDWSAAPEVDYLKTVNVFALYDLMTQRLLDRRPAADRKLDVLAEVKRLVAELEEEQGY